MNSFGADQTADTVGRLILSINYVENILLKLFIFIPLMKATVKKFTLLNLIAL